MQTEIKAHEPIVHRECQMYDFHFGIVSENILNESNLTTNEKIS